MRSRFGVATLAAMSATFHPPVARSLRIDALVLSVLAAWAFLVRFINPMCLAWAMGAVDGELRKPYIMWDFWWISYLVLAYWFWRRKRYAWELGIGVSIIEIGSIIIHFSILLSDPLKPQTDAPPLVDRFLTASWFVNKTVLLAFFIYLLMQLSQKRFRAILSHEPHGDSHSHEIGTDRA